jgi:flagellar biosynthesis GTPase FlhF
LGRAALARQAQSSVSFGSAVAGQKTAWTYRGAIVDLNKPGITLQSGQTVVVALAVTLGVVAAAFLFLYLPYVNAKEEAAQRAVLEARKAAEAAAKQAAEERARAAVAEAQLAITRARAVETRQKIDITVRQPHLSEAAEERREQRLAMERERNVQRVIAEQERDAQRAAAEQRRNAQRMAAEQRQIDELRLRCESTRKMPLGPSRDAAVHQACTRYDDAVRRQHVGSLNR